MSEVAEQEITVVSKMSVKTIGCNPRAVAAKPADDNTPVVLCRIYGNATGTKVEEDSRSGNLYYPITGNFEAQLLQVAEGAAPKLIRSGVLYLPKGIHEMLYESVKDHGKGSTPVNFALEVRAVKATNPIGYSYEAVPLIKPVEVDQLAAMRGALPQLKPAPALGTGAKK